MLLTWKDLVTTFLAVLVGLYTYFLYIGYKIPYIGNLRVATVLLLIAGIGMCALSSYKPSDGMTFWSVTGSTLGVIALVLAIASLVMGTQFFFMTFAGTILLLWLLTTVHHIFAK